MNMTRFLAALAALGIAAGTANAASMINPDGSISLDTSSPFSFTMNYNGFDTQAHTSIPGLTGQITFDFTGTANSGKTLNFTYSITNTSSSPVTASRISGFGFNTDPNVTGGDVTGVFGNVTTGGGNVPNVGTIEVCVSAVNCAGGGGSGVTIGNTDGGALSLDFASAPTLLSMSDFYVRYQSISGISGLSSASGLGTPVGAVPEPAAWAMMIGGMGLVGAAMRRRSVSAMVAA